MKTIVKAEIIIVLNCSKSEVMSAEDVAESFLEDLCLGKNDVKITVNIDEVDELNVTNEG